jgi:excisionase family DNA binding protein
MSLLTVREAADKLHLSSATVYALVSARKIRHERHGLGRGSIRIPEDALDEYRRSVTVVAVGGAVQQPPPVKPMKFRHLKVS